MLRHVDAPWQCNLEINANTENTTNVFNLQALQGQGFNKVTILTSYSASFKKNHYLFYQSEKLPLAIVGVKFSSYRLVGTEDGWLLILTHVIANEETNCFLYENAREIVIDNVRYAIYPSLASLFAIDSADDFPLNGNNLIAPIRLTDPFSPHHIQVFQNNTYRVNDIKFYNLRPNTQLYFSDQMLPFSYIKYCIELNQTESVSRSKRSDEHKALKKRSITKSAMQSQLLPSIASVPLLDIPKLSSLPQLKLFNKWENSKRIESDKCDKDFSGSVNYTGDFNTQLVFANYLLYYANKVKKIIRKPTTKQYIPRNEAYLNPSANDTNLTQVAVSHHSIP